MSDFNNVKLRRLDLTVLLVFLGLVRHRKAVVVARDLGLTPPAVSHALGRLRDVFGDPLFLRRPHGLEPTSVALALEAPVREAVERLREALSGERPFEPAGTQRTFRLAASDSVQALLMPGLVRRVAGAAPLLQLGFVPVARDAAVEAVCSGAVDLALGVFRHMPGNMIAETLYVDSYLVVARPGAFATAGLTIEQYLGRPHVLVSARGDQTGVVDDALARLGRARRVIASVPHFFPALAAVSETDCIATLPRRLALRYAGPFGLETHEPPLKLRPFGISALRHRRNEHDQALAWLVARMRDTLEGTGAEPG